MYSNYNKKIIKTLTITFLIIIVLIYPMYKLPAWAEILNIETKFPELYDSIAALITLAILFSPISIVLMRGIKLKCSECGCLYFIKDKKANFRSECCVHCGNKSM
jgi:hypothetical protein